MPMNNSYKIKKFQNLSEISEQPIFPISLDIYCDTGVEKAQSV